MILAAGLGTRLQPLTDELPKPIVPLGNAPLLVQIERHLAAAGIDRVVVNTHHKAESFEQLTGHLPLPTSFCHEPRILGTAGGVANARGRFPPGEAALLWNGDIYADIDVAALGRALVSSPGASAAWAVAPRPKGQGTVGLDRQGQVVRVRDARVGVEVAGGDFLGVQWLAPDIIEQLPDEGCMVGDVLKPMLERGRPIVTVEHAGPWDDIGTPAAYLRANLRWLRAQGQAAAIGEGATFGGAQLDEVILGEGARIDGEGALQRCVLWPGAVATPPLSDAIVTTSGVIVRVA